jgi:RNA polymerase sigma-70 factor (ECF subfamily)
LHGAEAIATGERGGARGAVLAVVVGATGFVWAPAGQVRGVVQFTIRGGRILAIDVTGDPDCIAALDVVTLDA